MTSKADVLAAREAYERDALLKQCAKAMVRAFRELNEIRARDGVPYTHMGYQASVDQDYFSSVIDGLDAAVRAVTGKSAHCHPLLYERNQEPTDDR